MCSPDCGVDPLVPPAAALDIDAPAEDTGPAVRAEENMLRPCIPPAAAAAALPVAEEMGALDEKNMFAHLLRLHTLKNQNESGRL